MQCACRGTSYKFWSTMLAGAATTKLRLPGPGTTPKPRRTNMPLPASPKFTGRDKPVMLGISSTSTETVVDRRSLGIQGLDWW